MITVKATGKVRGTVMLPSSKSICNRALVINALAENEAMPRNLSDCDDTRVMVEWLTTQPQTVNIGAAGTAMRFSTALLSVGKGERVITGTERMKNRPIGVLVDALRELGANITYTEKEGYPPLLIKGNDALEGGELALSGSVSSQYVSALLMVAPMLKHGLKLVLTGNIVSRPYIEMTMSMMREYGAKAEWQDDNTIVVAHSPYIKRDYFVESDWSAASYWYEMTALAKEAEVELPGLFAKSLQGDAGGAKVFESLGVSTEYGDNTVVLRKTGNVTEYLKYDFVEMPDLAQTFVVTCCMLGVHFHFTGLQSLKIKETDRIEALKRELRKLGYVVEDRNDSELIWNGERCEAEPDAAIDTYEDHRMAMAFAPCALTLGSININDPHVVTKSYPHYWDNLKSAGFQL
jgi:3-phosphoshikimate 1-carboxyvinyltransferase